MTYGAWETNQMGESFSNNSGKIEKRRISLEEFFFFFPKNIWSEASNQPSLATFQS